MTEYLLISDPPADWVKMDWCNSAPQVPNTTYHVMGQAMNQSGRHMHFNMCEWGKDHPWEWGDSCAQSWRMSADHTPIWDSTKHQIAASTQIPAEYSGKAFGWSEYRRSSRRGPFC